MAGCVDWATAGAFVASAGSETAATGVTCGSAAGTVSFGDVDVSTAGVWRMTGVRA
jgi:hypothetical protein